MTTQQPTLTRLSSLSVTRCAVTGALSLVVLMAVCWIGALVAGQQSHAYISLFTKAPVDSVAALIQGIVWSVAFGAVSGALVALIYNSVAFLDRRR